MRYISNFPIWETGDSMRCNAFPMGADYRCGLSAQRIGFEGVITTLVPPPRNRCPEAPLIRSTERFQRRPRTRGTGKNLDIRRIDNFQITQLPIYISQIYILYFVSQGFLSYKHNEPASSLSSSIGMAGNLQIVTSRAPTDADHVAIL